MTTQWDFDPRTGTCPSTASRTQPMDRTLEVSLAAIKSRVLRGRRILRESLIRCCEIELGVTGQVVGCTPRAQDLCRSCELARA